MSTTTASALPPSLVMTSTVSPARSGSISAMTTLAPAFASAREMPAPIPPPPPVTTAMCPLRSTSTPMPTSYQTPAMTTDAALAELQRKIDRLDSIEQIRQLVSRYALALDSRDVPALVDLFVEDVQVGRGQQGRDALAAWFDPILRPYRTTFHLIGNHIIDF